ncbi:MAG TPA: hypothetical protein VFW92_08375 [Candidatus Limnocylindrales bacterium]|nr:hypothetical protein [Candidatus Limnocylindrales bacterium]
MISFADAKVASALAEGDDKQFMLARLSAYHDVVSLMQQQAKRSAST